jgi:hypothetical protein
MHGSHQAFFGLKMVKNSWQSLSVFWMGNNRKRLVATKHFLDLKWLKMPSDH